MIDSIARQLAEIRSKIKKLEKNIATEVRVAGPSRSRRAFGRASALAASK